MRTDVAPPRVVSALFSRLVPPALRNEMMGDLVERYRTIASEKGRKEADRWAWAQLMRLRPFRLRGALRTHGRSLGPAPGRGGGGGWAADVRLGARRLRTRPGASLTVVATVALAVGATTAVFSVVQGVLLRPLPYPESDRLVRLWQVNTGWLDSPNSQLRSFANRFPLSVPTLSDWTEANLGFDAIGGWAYRPFVYQGVDGAEVIHGEAVTSGYLSALGIEPALGRPLLSEDDQFGAPRVAVLAHGLWQELFGADMDVLGQSIDLDGTPHTVVGVMPAAFQAPVGSPRVWVPLTDEEKAGDRGSQFLSVVGRLGPETSVESARNRLAALQERLAGEYPDDQGGLGSRAQSLLESMVGDVRSTLWLLLGAVGLVLTIACVNIANMLSVMGVDRRKELAVKAALGAGPGRLVRGLLAECMILAGIGGGLGVALAWASLPALLRVIPSSVPRFHEIGIDGTVLLFGIAVTAGTAMLVGAVPALQARGADPQRAINGSSRGSSDDRVSGLMRSTLVVTEVALAFVLLVGAGLLASSFSRLWSVDRGFPTEGLVAIQASPDPLTFPELEDQRRFLRLLHERLNRIPGVSASATNQVPLTGSMSSTTYELEREDGNVEEASLVISVVLEDYFSVMSIPLVEGRALTERDDADAPLVGVVNHAMAQRLWPGESALGKRLRSGPEADWTTVVGVVGNVKHQGLSIDVEPKIYVPVGQNHRVPGAWVLRSRGALSGVADLARSEITQLTPTTPVRSVVILEDQIVTSVAVPRFRAFFVVGLALMAAGLALIGVYGVVTYAVDRRSREIGVRMALGAHRRRVVRDVVGSGLKLSMAGVAAGLLAALAGAGLLAEFLFQVDATDPLTYGAIALGVTGVTALAAYVPARRAATIDPVSVLGSE